MRDIVFEKANCRADVIVSAPPQLAGNSCDGPWRRVEYRASKRKDAGWMSIDALFGRELQYPVAKREGDESVTHGGWNKLQALDWGDE